MVLSNLLGQIASIMLKLFLILLLRNTHYSYFTHARPHFRNLNSNDLISSLKDLRLNGYFDFNDTSRVANDFGNQDHFLPLAILIPNSVSDISATIKLLNRLCHQYPNLTVTPRGHGHSLKGQSQNQGGIVISMESLATPNIQVQTGKLPYVEVSGGELWINILLETTKYGLAPKSWTDYLNLTVGGTLSNAGISGQAFRHGPEINNVYQLEVVTGKGDIVNCSETQNSDLFYGVLGGLGQFGIITKARISLEPAYKLVKWIRLLYSDVNLFTKDQEDLISLEDTFDFIEGFVLNNIDTNSTSPFSSIGAPGFGQISIEGKTLFCLEVVKYFNSENENTTNQKIENLLSRLNHTADTIFRSEVSYVDFLNRIRPPPELKPDEKVTFPWLTLLVPKSKIQCFAAEVFGNILKNITYEPILIYPFNQSRWKDKTSLVTPEEDVIYLAAFLGSALGSDGLENLLTMNRRILDFCEKCELGVKQYLPYYDTQEGWRGHFGTRWELFAQRKSRYDPLSILTPGQRIFSK